MLLDSAVLQQQQQLGSSQKRHHASQQRYTLRQQVYVSKATSGQRCSNTTTRQNLTRPLRPMKPEPIVAASQHM
jgi:hypothetical protein